MLEEQNQLWEKHFPFIKHFRNSQEQKLLITFMSNTLLVFVIVNVRRYLKYDLQTLVRFKFSEQQNNQLLVSVPILLHNNLL